MTALKTSILAAAMLVLGVVAGVFFSKFSANLRWPVPAAAPGLPAGPPLQITLGANIDGSDRFVFAGENLWNVHLVWQAPKDVFFNGEPWLDLTVTPPGWSEVARQLDLSGAKIVERKGRDVIALELTPDGFDVFFADTQMGGAVYEVTISIPRK